MRCVGVTLSFPSHREGGALIYGRSPYNTTPLRYVSALSEGRGLSPFHSGRRKTDVHRTSCDPAP